MKPHEYIVTCKLIAFATSPADAAERALAALRRSGDPVVMAVRQAHGKTQTITIRPM